MTIVWPVVTCRPDLINVNTEITIAVEEITTARQMKEYSYNMSRKLLELVVWRRYSFLRRVIPRE